MIIGERLQLRAIEEEDLPLMVKWRNDPAIYQYFFEQEPVSLVMQRRWFASYLDRPDERLWIIEIKKTHEAIGQIGLVGIDWRNRKAEYARFLIWGDQYHGMGYGAEAEGLITRYAFEHLNLNRLYGQVLARNSRILALHEKTGYTVEGLLRQHIYKDGEYQDVVFIGLLREEYLTLKRQRLNDDTDG